MCVFDITISRQTAARHSIGDVRDENSERIVTKLCTYSCVQVLDMCGVLKSIVILINTNEFRNEANGEHCHQLTLSACEGSRQAGEGRLSISV